MENETKKTEHQIENLESINLKEIQNYLLKGTSTVYCANADPNDLFTELDTKLLMFDAAIKGLANSDASPTQEQCDAVWANWINLHINLNHTIKLLKDVHQAILFDPANLKAQRRN